MPKVIFSIGHSNMPFEEFLALLKSENIEILVDVRSHPVSRFAPWSASKHLAGKLAENNIEYLFLGNLLGCKPADKKFYTADGKPDFKKIAKSAEFIKGIQRLAETASQTRTVVMCAEEAPENCHRSIIIEPALKRMGFTMKHIRKRK